MRKQLIAVALLLWFAGLGCVRPEIREGEALFRQHCANCHGPAALGTKVAPAIHPERRRDVIQEVRYPRGQMPAFSPQQLSDAELKKIVDFLMWLHTQSGIHAH